MSAPSREVQALLDRLRAIADQIEGHEATLHMLKAEQLRTRCALAATGYKPEPREMAK